MILKQASKEAVKYAILKWHYSKSVPSVQAAYAVFNDDAEFCGVICFAIGANTNIASPFGLDRGEVVELVRVSLNGRQGQTSKALSIALRMFHKNNPLVKAIVSYADEAQGHHGGIYQATNWLFVGDSISRVILADGKMVHAKTYHSLHGTQKGAVTVKCKPKHKYVYIFDAELKKR